MNLNNICVLEGFIFVCFQFPGLLIGSEFNGVVAAPHIVLSSV